MCLCAISYIADYAATHPPRESDAGASVGFSSHFTLLRDLNLDVLFYQHATLLLGFRGKH